MGGTIVDLQEKFFEISEFCDDKYWENVFLDMSKNKLPKGVTMNNEKGTVTIKKYVVVYKQDQPLGKFYNNITSLLRNHLKMYSPFDLVVGDSKTPSPPKTWKDIKPRKNKDDYITNYIVNLKNKYSLSEKEFERIYCTIFLGFQMKKITQKDIIFEEGKVKNIKNLKINKEGKIVMSC